MTPILFAVCIAVLFGLFKAITDIRRDQPRSNKLFHWCNYLGLSRWYEGGSENGYSQRLPWESDLWHLFDEAKLYLLIAACFIGLSVPWYLIPVVFVGMLWICGRTFALFYHGVLPDEPTLSFGKWFLNSFLFWQAENK